MGLTAKKSGESFDPVSEGVHLCVCYGIWDLGTQYNEKWDTSSRKVIFSWEVPEERITVERDGVKQDLPRVISKMYTLSLSDKANLRHDLETWRGKEFTKTELDGFDLQRVLGVSCMLQVMHKEKDGKMYANITNIIPAPKGTTVDPENPVMFFSFEENKPIPEKTPEWIQSIIKNSSELNGAERDVQSAEDALTVPEEDNSDVPF